MAAATKQAALVGAGVAVIILSAKLLRHAAAKILRSFDKYDGLDGVVSFSSRKIAAARAMEAEEENALVKDPLAAALAGPRALADSRQRQQPAPATSGRKIKVNLMAIRTKWFDDQLEASLGMPLGHLASAGDYVATTAKPGATPRQVVLLGAGMDSRAWRLKLPAGLRWFEIDRQDVLEAKELLLEAAGAEVEPTTPFRRSKSVNALLEAKIGTFDHHEAGVQYPLRAESWAGVAADLEDPSWVKTLADAGFDRSKPTVWIAEGLLMYLAPQRAQELLQEMAQASASGSALITVSVTEDVIKGLKANGTKSELLATWRFGCPADPTQWLKASGWRAELVATRGSLARVLGLTPDVCAFDIQEGSEKDGRSLFIAASLAEE